MGFTCKTITKSGNPKNHHTTYLQFCSNSYACYWQPLQILLPNAYWSFYPYAKSGTVYQHGFNASLIGKWLKIELLVKNAIVELPSS
jgi:hypothetical protein